MVSYCSPSRSKMTSKISLLKIFSCLFTSQYLGFIFSLVLSILSSYKLHSFSKYCLLIFYRSVLDSDDIHSYLPQFNLEVNEVCAAVWLPRPVLNKLSDDWKAFEKHFQNQSTISNSEYLYPELSTMPSTFQIDNDQTEVWYWGVNSLDWQSVPVNQLICGLTSSRNPTIPHNTRPESEVGNGPSHVTLGTLYAISHWLSSTNTISIV
ncbi:unnamed protein product [Schistosoma margrebowiei]|uniref:Uncharacterized protein n=1 Tax=Schistosoma margrebowiei TaxID=48269 RepID=A0A183N1Y7_9TREM|nr:unnamed protein product [Schistosoma margrebowiei]